MHCDYQLLVIIEHVHGIRGNMWPSKIDAELNVKRSGVRFPLLVMCQQTSHSILPLLTQR